MSEERHPLDHLLRADRLPHIWCPGCGIGIAMRCLVLALEELRIPLDRTVVVSGIGCSARVAGYVRLDGFHTTHGRAIPFATGLKLANPDLTVIVFSGDGDLAAIGGNHLIHAARRNVDLTVICVNNFIYGMTGGQSGPTTPLAARSTTTPYGNFEPPFNLPALVAASGAVYVARWTVFHVRRLITALQEAITKRGFSFVEILSPCPTGYLRRNKLGDALDMMRVFKTQSEIRHGAPPAEVGIELGKKLILGKFVDLERPTYHERMRKQLAAFFIEPYVEKVSEEVEAEEVES
ncbi:2-oxoglutarate oxidoreductase subunit KorB [bacterium HR10]|uniref:2-oxoglutarate ferredoxin oxidoreductase subunit beta n=1 Tax=uncultured Acidobacteriota bacterium TaxID=171953 RepID=H5SH66_9BACT|nr:2-oxoglutarate ferredoxin oxidoreductase subunit beta [uncultured Acidobacteriota bacterium]GBC81901.1 2-oxoglutarate oxidoreductase subunit KorB [bacterium HR10]